MPLINGLLQMHYESMFLFTCGKQCARTRWQGTSSTGKDPLGPLKLIVVDKGCSWSSKARDKLCRADPSNTSVMKRHHQK